MVAPDTQSRLMSVRDALRYLSVGKTSFYKLLGKGEIRAAKVGARTLVLRESLDAFVATRPSFSSTGAGQ